MNFSTSQGEEILRLLLVGKTGTGKSSVGNTLLGRDVFRTGVSFSSVTKNSQTACRTIGGTKIQVVDTPGFLDAGKPLNEVATILVQDLSWHAILYVLQIGQRFTQEDVYVYKALKKIFGEAVRDRVVLVFTGGDKLQAANLQTKDLLKNVPRALSDVLTDCKHKFVVFNNFAEDKSAQAENLLTEINNTRNPSIPMKCQLDLSDKRQLENKLGRIFDEIDEEER